MIRPSVEKLIEVMKGKGHAVYDTPNMDWNLNIVGIRASDPEPGTFNDTLTVFQRFQGSWEISYYPITTDPSLYYLRHPVNSSGAAILKEGQYKGAYKLDVHNRGLDSGHLALCQRLKPVTVYRDSNRDAKLNLIERKTQSGMFNINIHRTSEDYIQRQRFSAGCQVFAEQRQFADFIRSCQAGEKAFGNKFTYTLLHERDF
uniref:hypothetical protein n=1 Tax=Candidatus Electronema sp. TaxID=2698783 RepID=UPI004055C8E8